MAVTVTFVAKNDADDFTQAILDIVSALAAPASCAVVPLLNGEGGAYSGLVLK